MANLTLSLDDTGARNTRIKAIQDGTSVSAKVREFLQAYIEGADAGQTQARHVATGRWMKTIADASQASQASPTHAPDAPDAAKGDTQRNRLCAGDFRKIARDTVRAESAAPLPRYTLQQVRQTRNPKSQAHFFRHQCAGLLH